MLSLHFCDNAVPKNQLPIIAATNAQDKQAKIIVLSFSALFWACAVQTSKA